METIKSSVKTTEGSVEMEMFVKNGRAVINYKEQKMYEREKCVFLGHLGRYPGILEILS